MLRGLAGYEGLLIYGLTRVTRGPVAGIYTELAQAATRFPKVISRQTIPRLAHTTDTVPASNIHLGARSRINSTVHRESMEMQGYCIVGTHSGFALKKQPGLVMPSWRWEKGGKASLLPGA